MRHIPNVLSFIRILLVGVFIWCFATGRYTTALSVYTVAFLTDILDGRLARRFRWESNIGKLLDPLADKLLNVSALACIYIGKRTPVYLVLFALNAVKEILMILGALVMATRRYVAHASWVGKLTTCLTAVGIVLTLLSFSYPAAQPFGLGALLAGLACASCALLYYAVTQFSGAFGKRPQA